MANSSMANLKNAPTEGYILFREAYRGSGYDLTLVRFKQGEDSVRVMSVSYQSWDQKSHAYVNANALELLNSEKPLVHGGALLAADADKMMEQFSKLIPFDAQKDTIKFSNREFSGHSLQQAAQSLAQESIRKNDAYVDARQEVSMSETSRIQVHDYNDKGTYGNYTTIAVANNTDGKKDRIVTADENGVRVSDDNFNGLGTIKDPALADKIRKAAAGALADGRFSVQEASQLEGFARQALETANRDKDPAPSAKR